MGEGDRAWSYKVCIISTMSEVCQLNIKSIVKTGNPTPPRINQINQPSRAKKKKIPPGLKFLLNICQNNSDLTFILLLLVNMILERMWTPGLTLMSTRKLIQCTHMLEGVTCYAHVDHGYAHVQLYDS